MAIQGLSDDGLLISQPSYAAPSTVHHSHAICWRAVFAGAVAAAALSILLSILGTGFGLSIVSPWSASGVTAATFGISAILWLSITQIIASGMGGFLAGRLRSRTPNVDTDEVYFRDTAHGFLTWAIALIVTATLFASALGSLISGSVKAGAAITSGAVATTAAGVAANDSNGYFIDSLFRKAPEASSSVANKEDPTMAGHYGATRDGSTNEVRRIFEKSIQDKAISSTDVTYVGQIVAARTGIPQADAEKRVQSTFTAIQNAEQTVKKAADKARIASAYIALWAFIALLIGAFTASLAATWGGRCRDTD